MILLSMAEVAKLTGYSYHYFSYKIQHSKGFPKPIRIHPKARPKWTLESLKEYTGITQEAQ